MFAGYLGLKHYQEAQYYDDQSDTGTQYHNYSAKRQQLKLRDEYRIVP